MRTFMILFLTAVTYTFMGFDEAIADPKGKPKPDSIVHCLGDTFGPDYLVDSRTVPASVNLDQCVGPGPGNCSPCIRSLEKQDCKVVDLTVTQVTPVPTGGFIEPGAIFVLSCAKP